MTDSVSAAAALSGRHPRQRLAHISFMREEGGFDGGAIDLKEAKRSHRSVLRILVMRGFSALFALACDWRRSGAESSAALTNREGKKVENPRNLSRHSECFTRPWESL